MAQLLEKPTEDDPHPWPPETGVRGIGRWGSVERSPFRLVLRTLVVEVSVDTAVGNGRWRHPVLRAGSAGPHARRNLAARPPGLGVEEGVGLVPSQPEAFALVPVVVMTQTLVELLAMVVYVRLVPRLVGPSLDVPSDGRSR